MVKVNKVIDMGCRDLIVLDDGRAINQPKSACTINLDAGEVSKQLNQVVDTINETIYVKSDRPLFLEVKEGQELTV